MSRGSCDSKVVKLSSELYGKGDTLLLSEDAKTTVLSVAAGKEYVTIGCTKLSWVAFDNIVSQASDLRKLVK